MQNAYVVDFFANYLIDALVFTQDILALNYDPPQPLSMKKMMVIKEYITLIKQGLMCE